MILFLVLGAFLLFSSFVASFRCVQSKLPSSLLTDIDTKSETNIMHRQLNLNNFKVKVTEWDAVDSTIGWIHSLRTNTSILVIDGDNLRGKTKFLVSKMQLLQDIQQFLSLNKMFCPVYLYFDHGMKEETVQIPSINNTFQLSVIFSGPGRSADDAIASTIPILQTEYNRDVVLITEDTGLRKRCKRQSQDSRQNIKKSKKAKKSIDPKAAVNDPVNSVVAITSPTFLDYLYDKPQSGSNHSQTGLATSSLSPKSSKQDIEAKQIQRNRRADPIVSSTFHTPSDSLLVNNNAERGFVNLAVRPIKGIEKESDKLIRESLEYVQAQLRILISMQKIQRKLMDGIDEKGIKATKLESAVLYQKYQKLSAQLQLLSGLTFDKSNLADFHEQFIGMVIQKAADDLEAIPNNRRNIVEESWERVILAEQFRLKLHQLFDNKSI